MIPEPIRATPELQSLASAASPPTSVIREEILRDPRYPIHRIADRFLPYLRVLVEQFHPEQVILFGSYAYGTPDEGSDVDLLVVCDYVGSALAEKLRIRRAWKPLYASQGYLSIQLLVVTPAHHLYRLQHAAGFYDQITEQGLRLV